MVDWQIIENDDCISICDQDGLWVADVANKEIATFIIKAVCGKNLLPIAIFSTQKYPKPKMVKRICSNKSCKSEFEAREVDVKRGWGRFCSKSCKAVRQEQRTGQYAKHCNMLYSNWNRTIDDLGEVNYQTIDDL